ncbi:hypothetical protein NPIL_284841 [Nephila pilipes]|uniref:Uncharacterized protein n=1 Tax=Nephila pilipes TaxID=299642 RepID=A0A8X6QWZ2_NEPPI|nr:hypothetical protein NPIL_284841 [Nephila pilipes]
MSRIPQSGLFPKPHSCSSSTRSLHLSPALSFIGGIIFRLQDSPLTLSEASSHAISVETIVRLPGQPIGQTILCIIWQTTWRHAEQLIEMVGGEWKGFISIRLQFLFLAFKRCLFL